MTRIGSGAGFTPIEAGEVHGIGDAPETGTPASTDAGRAAGLPARGSAPSGRMAALAALHAQPAPPSVDAAQVSQDTDALYVAMRGWGTDEKAIYDILEHRTPEHLGAIEACFASKYGEAWETLRSALHDELTGDDRTRAFDALNRDRPVTQQRGEIMLDQGKTSGVGRTLRHLGTWLTFGMDMGGVDPANTPRVTGADFTRDALPNLKPGDIILCGNRGGLSHAIMYEGDGKIIHSMATEKSMRSGLERAKDVITAPIDIVREKLGLKERQQGVIREDAAAFFDRVPRDTYVIMRSPGLTPEKTEAGLDHIRGLLGKGYDWDFAPGNDSYYCTEVVGEFLREALGEEAPRIAARPQHVKVLLDREAVVDPLDVFESPDLQPVHHNPAAELKFKDGLTAERG